MDGRQKHRNAVGLPVGVAVVGVSLMLDDDVVDHLHGRHAEPRTADAIEKRRDTDDVGQQAFGGRVVTAVSLRRGIGKLATQTKERTGDEA